MNKLAIAIIFLLLFCIGCYMICLPLLGSENFQIAAIISELLTLIAGLLLFNNKNSRYDMIDQPDESDMEQPSFFDSLAGLLFIPLKTITGLDVRVQQFSLLIATIVVGNAILGIFNLQHILSFVNFSEVNQETSVNIGNISLVTGSLSIIISQIGGWFLQVILVYLLAVLLDTKNNFSFYAKIVGFAYVGFFLSSLVLLIYNLFSFSEMLPMEAFYETMQNSNLRIIIGKAGEFWTLCLIAYFIVAKDQVKPTNALVIAFVPNILLMSSFLFFKYLF